MPVRELSFRGFSYKIECLETYPYHPSWFSFDDESSVRDRDWHISSGDVVLDVGAAYGSYALTALAVGANFVYAWSPQGPPNERTEKETLEESLKLNGWSDKCIIYKSGVYSSTGHLNVCSQTLVDNIDDPYVIEVEPLDVWHERVQPNKIDWVKFDVEGAEVEALNGALNLIKKHKPKFLIENHIFVRQ